jgi:predicted nucleotidyltransferase
VQIDDDALRELAGERGIVLALVYGSAARGSTHAHSDLDVAVLLERMPSGDQLLRLYADAERIAPRHRVDLAILNHADPLFLYQAVRDAKLLFGNPTAFAELQARAFRQYVDHRRYLDLERDYARRL